jgi:cytochrome c556
VIKESEEDIAFQSVTAFAVRPFRGTAWFFGAAVCFILLAAFALILVGKTSGGAQAAAPADSSTAIATRKTNFNELEDAVRALRKELDHPAPNFTQVLERARFIEMLSRRLPDWFPSGTGPESGVSTRALADIWQQPDEFRQAAAGFAAQAIALEAAASRSDTPITEQRIRDMGRSCQACHDQFRGSWWPFW